MFTLTIKQADLTEVWQSSSALFFPSGTRPQVVRVQLKLLTYKHNNDKFIHKDVFSLCDRGQPLVSERCHFSFYWMLYIFRVNYLS